MQLPISTACLDPREAFLRAWPEMCADRSDTPAYLVAAVPNIGPVVVRPLGLAGEPTTALVIGRHKSCGLLVEDPTVSLRHLLALRTPGGELRLMDLRTPHGLIDEQGRPFRSCIAEGHALLRVGTSHVLFYRVPPQGLPTAPAEEVWNDLPTRRHVDPPASFDSISGLHFRPRLRLVESADETLILHVPGTLRLDAVDISNDGAVGAVTIGLKGLQQSARISAAALSRGLLIGRYKRCQIAGSALRLPPTISRVHLCLLLDNAGVWAIDLGSYNGTTMNGKRIGCARIRRRASLELSETVTVRWEQAAANVN